MAKMSYGDGAVQWMTAGRGMLHEEMWDVSSANEQFELYQAAVVRGLVVVRGRVVVELYRVVVVLVTKVAAAAPAPAPAAVAAAAAAAAI